MLLDTSDGRPIHFMGIAGAGMNALAELFVRSGVAVTGCDLNPLGTDNLARQGIEVLRGHSGDHVAGARALVVTSAVPKEHPELLRALELGIPVIRRAEALAEAVSKGRLIGIAGTHGKTTTTVLTTFVLEAAGLAPTGVVGGRVGVWQGNLRRGDDRVFVVEADEYDRSFLALKPEIAVVTNVEADHLDIYADLADVRSAFSEFASKAKVAVVCSDDAGAATLPIDSAVRLVTYGLGGENRIPELRAEDIVTEGRGCSFRVRRGSRQLGAVRLAVPGLHNVRNALAALTVGLEIAGESAFQELAAGAEKFTGVERRFEVVGEAGGATIVDDYAHHPTEIAATLATARQVYKGRRLLAAFQPHLYSRTRDFATDFGSALAQADAVFLTDIYPAREAPIPGVDSSLIMDALHSAGGNLAWAGTRADLVSALAGWVKPGDVVITLGAGDITGAGRELLRALA